MTYRILSLDGGGAWALIEVRALIALYGPAATDRQVLGDFDMAVANSGGSIVLGGLVEDLPLSQLSGYFEDEQKRRSIFQPTARLVDRELNHLLGFAPKYSAKAKLPALQRLMPAHGNAPITTAAAGVRRPGAAADLHLLIAGFDFDRDRSAFIRSAAAGGPGWGSGQVTPGVTLAQAIHASSNAPVNYFDEPAAFGNCRYWDGAIGGYNNPVLAGVAEAICLGVTPTDIRALSLGTGTVRLAGPPQDDPPPYVLARSPQSVLKDLGKLAGCITDDPPDAASFLAHVMTGGPHGLPAGADSRVVRMNPMVSPEPDGAGGWRAPGGWTFEQFEYLAGISMDALDPHQIAYIADYAEFWIQDAAPNQPLRLHGDRFAVELGYGRFSQARAAWAAIQ